MIPLFDRPLFVPKPEGWKQMRHGTPKPDGFKQLMRGHEESKREEEITRSLSVPKPEG